MMSKRLWLIPCILAIGACQSDAEYFSLDETIESDWQSANAAIIDELGTRQFDQDRTQVATALCDGFVAAGFAPPDAILDDAFASSRQAASADLGPEIEGLEQERVAGSLAYFKAEVEGETAIRAVEEGSVVTILAELKMGDGTARPLNPASLRQKIETFWQATDAALAQGGPIATPCQGYVPAKLNIDTKA